MIGQTVGNYRIIEQIGLGGMATVYKAYDPDTDRYVALKILPQQFSHDPQFRQRFQREAKAIAKLEHIHILPIFAYGEDNGIAYMAMRYLQAGTLTDRIAAGPLSFEEASRILNQLAGALDHAHANGILHRDMKPSNVLLDEAGNAYLMDFGIAKIVEATIDLTGDRLLGTPAYMSPEQCKGEAITAASDIYSLGIILYEMVTGRRPFHAETPVAVILQQLNDPLPPPRDLRPDLPPAAENVIFKALAKEPDSRYRSAREMADAFAQAIAEADTAVSPARPVPPPAPPTEPIAPPVSAPPAPRRLPGWAWGLIGVTAAAVLISLGLLLANVTRPGNDAGETAAATNTPGAAMAAVPETGEPAEPAATDTAVPPPPTDQPAAPPLAEPASPAPLPTDLPLAPSAQGLFVESGQELTPGAGYVTALGDLDGDGDLDAFLGPEIWWNEGGAQGGQPGLFSNSGQTLPSPFRIALGDLDGDGDLDAFLGYEDGRPNQVWLNEDGRFRDSGQTLGENDSWAIALGDLDGDGDLDAFVGNWGADEVWLNDGAGRFSDSGQRLGDTESRAVGLEDLDGDGDLDAFVASHGVCHLWVNEGDGRFRDSEQPLCPANNVSLALGDLDGDGDVDAFVGTGSGDPDWVWLNQGGAQGGEPGLFQDSGQRLGDWGSEAVALGDLDGDGDLDVFIANSPGPNAVLLNDGRGQFSDAGHRLGEADSAGVALGDLDGDGALDALVGNMESPSRVWFNTGAQPETAVTNLRFVDSGQTIGSAGVGKSALGDLNGDGALDIFIAGDAAMAVWLNDGRARFTAGSQNQTEGRGVSNQAALGDLDGDGDLDALVGITQIEDAGENIIWFNDGSGRFTAGGQRLGGSHSWSVALGDLDGDGDLDVFDANSGPNLVWLNEGDGRFTESGQSLGGGDSVAVALGDLDGDGDLDAFVANFGRGEPNQLFLNDGNGRFQQTGQELGQSASIGVALGDLDGDGDLDAFVANGGNGREPNKVWWNDGNGRFTDSGQRLGDEDSWAVALGDLDGDGDLDAFVGNGPNLGGQANTIWLNDGGGRFTDSGLRLGNGLTRYVSLGDLDGDGDLDAFISNDGGNRVWLNETGEGETAVPAQTIFVDAGAPDGPLAPVRAERI